MRPATGQNPSDPALAPGKHSIESDSPSSTNLGSDLADVVGTPLIAGITESEPHTEPTKGEKAGRERSEQAAVEPGQSEPERGPTPDKPSLKRKLGLPDKVISNILDHTFLLTLGDPVFAPLSRTRLPFWRHLYHDQGTICFQFDYRWKILEFATWLKDVQIVDETWSAIVENHPFWATFLTQRPSFIRDGDRGSSRIADPRWSERVQPGRKEPKMHSSLRAEAESTCWICVLHHGPVNMPFPSSAKIYIETTPFHNIPICDAHAEHELCHCCLQLDGQVDPLNLCAPLDYDSFHIDDPSIARVCGRCRFDAVQKAFIEFPVRFRPCPSLSICHQNYLHLGHGTAAGAVEHMYATRYAQTYLGLDDEYADVMKAWGNEVRIDCERRRINLASVQDIKLPVERIASLLENTVQTAIDTMIDEGRWITPRFLNDRLKRALISGVDPEQALPAIHVLNSPLTEPWKRNREIEVMNEWPIRHRLAPPAILEMMETDYVTMLPERVEGAMKNLKTMIFKIAQGNLDIAEAKATSMDPDELLAWLNDPRNHIKNWWNSQPFLKPITPTDIARAFASTSPDSESGTKRKRDDDDSLADEKADKVAKTQERAASAADDAESKMDMALQAAGPPTPKREGDSGTATFVDGMQLSLAMFTPEKVKRLPWPVPQQILSRREAEYLRMTDFEKAGVQWDSVYNVPAFASELDDTTKDILIEVWQSVTKPFSTCRCTICKRAIEYENKVAAAAENNAQYSQYLSLITSDVQAENMTDHHRSWLANQANLLHDAITLPGDHYSPLTTEDGNDFDRYDELESDEPYEVVDAEEEVRPEDDVSYDIPGARLQEGRR